MKKLIIALLFSSTAFAQEITPKQVIEKYIEAVGGEAKISQVTDLTMFMQGDVNGQDFAIEIIKKVPNKFLMVQSMNGTEMSKTVFDGEKAKVVSMGNDVPVAEDQLASLRGQSSIFAEPSYLVGEGITLSMAADEIVKDEDCYAINVDMGAAKIKEFYSKSSGLKLRQDLEAQGMLIVSYFKDYKHYEPGILFPTTMEQEIMGMTIVTKVTELNLNTDVPDSKFVIK